MSAATSRRTRCRPAGGSGPRRPDQAAGVTSSNGSSPNGPSSTRCDPTLGTAADVGRIGEAGLRAAGAVVEQVLVALAAAHRGAVPRRQARRSRRSPDGRRRGAPGRRPPARPAHAPGRRRAADRAVRRLDPRAPRRGDRARRGRRRRRRRPTCSCSVRSAPGEAASTSAWLHTFEAPADARRRRCTSPTSSPHDATSSPARRRRSNPGGARHGRGLRGTDGDPVARGGPAGDRRPAPITAGAGRRACPRSPCRSASRST